MSSAFGTVPIEVLPPHLQKRARELMASNDPRTRPISGPIESLPLESISPTVRAASRADYGMRLVRLPWSMLLADNRKYAPALKGAKPVLLLTDGYRATKRRAQRCAAEQLAGQPLLAGALQFTAVLYEPNRHARDIQNFSKLVCDALKGIAYRDDRQIKVAMWRCAGVDIDAPRLEITITPLTR